MSENSSIRLRLGDLIHAVIKNKKMILLLTLAGLLIGVVMSGLSFLRGELAKQYLITASAAVNNLTESGRYPTTGADYPRNEDMTMATGMVDSVIYVLKSDRNLSRVIEKTGLLGITNTNISSNLTLTQYESTRIIEASLYWRSADEGAEILTTVFTEGNQVLRDVLGTGNVTIINEPAAKYLIGGNLNASLWVYMTVMGFILGVMISVLRYLIQPTLTNVRDVDQLFGIETLAVLPDNKTWFERRGELLTESAGTDAISAELTGAAHILRHRLGSGEHKCVYITSANHEEGKSAVAANLAVSLSGLGYRVLLVDFDFHNPSLGKLFLDSVDYEHSFNALYHGEVTEAEAVTPVNGYLDLLPAIVERRAVVMDDNTISAVKRLSENYDYVLMDTPPVGMAADAMSLNQLADSVVFVIRYDASPVSLIRDALNKLDKSGTRVIGCVINGVKGKKERKKD
ncbi:MAG: AAA family ATPase [Clostridia bacterium]|nr:AAA family ATPase [Clostridia bacterium]